MVPATVVRSPSVAKRDILLIPERPFVSAAQLSVLPTPNDVTTPMPVTAIRGRPLWSRYAWVMVPSSDCLNERKPLSAPMPGGRHEDAIRCSSEWAFNPGALEYAG